MFRSLGILNGIVAQKQSRLLLIFRRRSVTFRSHHAFKFKIINNMGLFNSSRRRQKVRRILVKHWENKCVICNFEFVATEHEITFEHLIPKAKGGSNHINNLSPSHACCNNFRGDSSLVWAMKNIHFFFKVKKYKPLSKISKLSI
jgi:hypothetical protein